MIDQSELARLAKVHITTIVRLEAFDKQEVRGQSDTITAVVNALAKAGIELGENGSIFPGRRARGVSPNKKGRRPKPTPFSLKHDGN
jgi:hypothetical protein